MRCFFYSVRNYELPLLKEFLGESITFSETRLTKETAQIASGFKVVSIFANDDGSAPVLESLRKGGTDFLALRSAGFNHVDLEAAARLGITVTRVPEYSPYAVAEHAVALMLTLNRKIHRAFNRVREHNFALDGLMGFDIHGKTVGVIGTGKIGECFCNILNGFGAKVIAYDPKPRLKNAQYLELKEVLAESDILSFHCPLTPETKHLINLSNLRDLKPGVMIVNTSRGAVLDTKALIQGLKSQLIGGLALDVYEEEGDLFFKDLSDKPVLDDQFIRLISFPNVLMTAHQGFFTKEATTEIARVTAENIKGYFSGTVSNTVSIERVSKS
jgi:D-lactate dehydrogenase